MLPVTSDCTKPLPNRQTEYPVNSYGLPRRRFLSLVGRLAALIPFPFLATSPAAAPGVPPDPGRPASSAAPSSDVRARTLDGAGAVIDHWLAELDGAVTNLSAYSSYLRRARNCSPDQIDQAEALLQQDLAYHTLKKLFVKFEGDDDDATTNIDDLLEAVTGQPIAEILGYGERRQS